MAIDQKSVYRWIVRVAPVACATSVAVGYRVGGAMVASLAALLGMPILYLARHTHRLHLARLDADQRHAEEVADLHLRTIEALALAIDAKDNTTHEHLHRVVLYAETIGQELKLSEPEMMALRAAALLHDIGKLAVPEYIISKPGRLTEEEFERMKIHPIVGAEILQRVRFPYPVAPIVRSHHERWDGRGYPDGLKGTEIPIGARILATVDSFDALTSHRQYRRALSKDDALALLKKEAGAAYDPFIVRVFERIYPAVEKLIAARPQPSPEARLSTRRRIDKGAAPQAGLAKEETTGSSAYYSIVQARQELQILYELTQALGNSLNIDDTFKTLSVQLHKAIQFDTMAVYLIQEGALIPRHVEGVNASRLSRLKIPLGEGLSGWVAENGKYSLNGNPEVEPGYLQDPEELSRLRSAISVPMDSVKGVIGVLTLYSMRSEAFSVDDLRVVKAVAMKAGPSLNNALIHEEIGKSAQTDGLTGLPNARAFSARLQEEAARAARQNSPYTVFVIDLNGLKQINDSHGHVMGDEVLKAVAEALRTCLRQYDFLSRMGGDEFVLLLPGMKMDDTAAKRGQLAAVVAGVESKLPGIEISISIGCATSPTDRKTTEELLALADRRMYQHKREFYRSRRALAAATRSTPELGPLHTPPPIGRTVEC